MGNNSSASINSNMVAEEPLGDSSSINVSIRDMGGVDTISTASSGTYDSNIEYSATSASNMAGGYEDTEIDVMIENPLMSMILKLF